MKEEAGGQDEARKIHSKKEVEEQSFLPRDERDAAGKQANR